MKNIIYTGLILLTTFSCCQSVAQKEYKPAQAPEWEKVRTHIVDTWHLSKVDPVKNPSRGGLSLPYPYLSIRQGRNVLFCWDTYFTNAGLLCIDSMFVYAKNAIENQFAEIEQIGYVPNASESWALNRSQTPFLSMMVRELYEHMKSKDKTWLTRAYSLLRKDYLFWTDPSADAIENHTTAITGLQRFYHHATNEELLRFYSQLAPRFGFSNDIPDEQKLKMGEAWMAEAESGMDFTPRFENRCHEFIAIDLNSNLYLYEKNFAWMVKELGLTGEPDWEKKASERKDLINQYCWNEQRGLYMDYDFVNKRFSSVASIASFYPLWAGLASKKQAQKAAANLSLFEYAYGPTICEKTKQEHFYQWDYPAGWPPMYYLTARALQNYGYTTEAKRTAAKYLDVVAKNFNHPQPETYTVRRGETEQKESRTPGYVYEKYDVVAGTIYDAEYPSRSFQGWSYGVYIWCLDFYTKK